MTSIIIEGKTISCEVIRKRMRNTYLRIKNGVLVITCPKQLSEEEIVNIILKHKLFVLNHIDTKKEDVIHFLGKAYKPVFNISTRYNCQIFEDKIYISGTKDDINSYKMALQRFYATELQKVLEDLVIEAKRDFNDIVFPKIVIESLKSCFGNYHRKKNLIKIALNMAKYDILYIKSVLYHELSHVYYLDHSEKFYQIYESKFKGAKQIQHNLRKLKYLDII